jgi:SAM-dependent methyltransferase
MSHSFDKAYWESHWRSSPGGSGPVAVAPSPYVDTELAELDPGTALDAGCGEGAEAIRLAALGGRVTGADISAEALARAASRADAAGARVRWLATDLGAWQPDKPFDLVTTFYAHPDMPQLAFYERIADWVAPGGTLLVVGHGSAHHHGDGPQPPAEATVTAADAADRGAPPDGPRRARARARARWRQGGRGTAGAGERDGGEHRGGARHRAVGDRHRRRAQPGHGDAGGAHGPAARRRRARNPARRLAARRERPRHGPQIAGRPARAPRSSTRR